MAGCDALGNVLVQTAIVAALLTPCTASLPSVIWGRESSVWLRSQTIRSRRQARITEGNYIHLPRRLAAWRGCRDRVCCRAASARLPGRLASAAC